MAHVGDGIIDGKGDPKKVKFGDRRIGKYKRSQKEAETGVPMWLGQLQFDPEAGKFKQQGTSAETAGLRLKQLPLPLRKVLKEFPLNIRRRLTELDEAGLVRVAELPAEAIRQLRDMPNDAALGVLERLHDKLIKERGRGHNAESALQGIFKLDSRRKEQAQRRKKARQQAASKKKKKSSSMTGAMDGNTFARAFCLSGKCQLCISSPRFFFKSPIN